MKTLFLILLTTCSFHAAFSQLNPKKTISIINQKFGKISDYTADIAMKFEIPNVKMGNINAKIYYKQPNKFKMKAKGIFFLPKQNPMQNIMTMLKDTANFQAIASGKEIVNGVPCSIINILPIKDMGDLVLGKFWIDNAKILIMKSEITTKNNGTVITENKFGSNAMYALPDEIKIIMDVNKFKIPKMLALDINRKRKVDENPTEKKATSNIILVFSNYLINQKLSDASFVEEAK
jgi:hypothetical protein